MSLNGITVEDIEKVRDAAQRSNDAQVEEHGTDDDALACLLEFCEVLLGQTTVASFLRSQDLED